jgi:uncharacterized membrane protein (DUF485 family)
MMTLLVGIILAVGLVVVIFVWTSARTRREDARFTRRDVEIALEARRGHFT